MMEIHASRMKGRQGWKISNDVLSLFVMSGGGHIADIRVAGRRSVNPFWMPAWKTVDPWQYRKKDAGRFGCKLLSCIYGHNICLGAFGDPSPEEARAGLETHGEAPVSRWRCVSRRTGAKRLLFSYGCELPVVRMRLVRTIALEKGSNIIRIAERIFNMARCDTPFTMCQHVTFGPPFLEPGVTVFDMSGKRGRTFPGVFSDSQRMKSSTDFIWPDGPGKKGKIDLRTTGKGSNSDFAAIEMDRKHKHAWFSAVNPRAGLLVAYIWQRSDYPWIGVWEESFARKEKPWSGKSLSRGMEFTNTPFPIGLRRSVDMGRFDGQPTFRWLPARGSVDFCYSILALPVEQGCKGVAAIEPITGGIDIDPIG